MIRPFKPADTPDVLHIWKAANLQSHAFIPPSYWEEHEAYVRDICLPAAETFVAIVHQRPVGFISIVDHSFIGGLFVAPGWQSRGIGASLLDDCQQRFPFLALCAYEENPRAIAFYRSHGFSIVRRQTDANTGHAEVRMEWRI